MNIFLAGGSGLVGSAFARAAKRRGHRVTAVVGNFAGEIDGAAKVLRLDLTNEAATSSAVLDAFPDAIVNCAAVSVPEQCEKDPALSQTMNVVLPATLARLAHHLSARLVHLSSEQVFDGAGTKAYAPGDEPHPINLYARQKIESERLVQAAAAEFAVTVRLPLLTGNSLTTQRSVHERLLMDWAAGKTPRLFVDEFRQPCSAENVAEVVLELCERRDVRGVQHWAGAELLSRHEIGVRVREHFKLTEAQAPLATVTRGDVPDVARKRPARLAIDVSGLAGKLKTRQQTMADQLEELKLPPGVREWYFSPGG